MTDPLPQDPTSTTFRDLSDVVEYHPRWEDDYRLFVDQCNWHKVRPVVEHFKRLTAGKINYVGYGHPHENRPGFRFGGLDPSLEAHVARELGVTPSSETPPPVIDEDQPDLSKVGTWRRGRGRPPGPAGQQLYPFAKLRRVGDSFLIRGAFNHATVKVKASTEGKARGRTFSCLTVESGLLVVLTGGHGVEAPSTVVEV